MNAARHGSIDSFHKIVVQLARLHFDLQLTLPKYVHNTHTVYIFPPRKEKQKRQGQRRAISPLESYDPLLLQRRKTTACNSILLLNFLYCAVDYCPSGVYFFPKVFETKLLGMLFAPEGSEKRFPWLLIESFWFIQAALPLQFTKLL